jgi:hypothetical protein
VLPVHPFAAMCRQAPSTGRRWPTASRPPSPDAQDRPVDFKPLGIGRSLIRLVSTAVCTQEGSAVGEALAPLQLAVRVTDGTCIMVAIAQATFTHGRGGARDCDVLKTDLK